MRVGQHEIYWHRPLLGCSCPKTGESRVISSMLKVYLTAYKVREPNLQRPIELWPTSEGEHYDDTATVLFNGIEGDRHPRQTTINVRNIQDSSRFLVFPLPRSFARQLLTLPRQSSLESWLDSLGYKADQSVQTQEKLGWQSERSMGIVTENAKKLLEQVRHCLEPAPNSGTLPKPMPDPLTYKHTANRSFQVH